MDPEQISQSLAEIGRKGGQARAKRLSAVKRKEIAIKASKAAARARARDRPERYGEGIRLFAIWTREAIVQGGPFLAVVSRGFDTLLVRPLSARPGTPRTLLEEWAKFVALAQR
jgi:hypothetical protein